MKSEQLRDVISMEQLREQVEVNRKMYVNLKLGLYNNCKDRKLDGSKKNWDNALTVYSSKIQLLEEILEYIDRGPVSINNDFVNNSKS